MEPDSSSGDPDVDEDGNVIPPAAEGRNGEKGKILEDGKSRQDANAASTAALALAPTTPVTPLIRPQPTSGGTTLAILAQHFDMPQEFATFLREFDSAFLKGDYLFSLDVNAYWKVKYGLDHLVALIAGQVDTEKQLRLQMPQFLQDYFAIEDAAEDWDDEIRQKVFQLSKLVKIAGLGTKDAAKPLPVLPSEAMRLKLRLALEPWQVNPDEAGILQIAERIVQSIKKRRLMLMVVDVDPFSGIAFGGGKSQLLFQIMYWTFWLLAQERGVDHPFDARKDVVYRQDRARFVRLIGESYEVPIGVDEINQFCDMWEWQNPANKWIVHQIEMYRKVGRPIIGACSQIWILNKRFREIMVTHRLSVTKWDDDAYTGEATLFEKWGPPASQDEKENKWGREEIRIKFGGLTPHQFRFYSRIADKTRDMELQDKSLDDHTKANPNWLVEMQEDEGDTPKVAVLLRAEDKPAS